MKEYRIVEYNLYGKIHYTVERKGILFWGTLRGGPEDTILIFYSIAEAEEKIRRDKKGITSRVIRRRRNERR